MEGIPLFETELCHVFKVPSTDTLKSELWEGNHIWSGSLRVFQDRIELFDAANGIFGVCPLKDDPDAPIAVRPTSDSRRCFVVRVEQNGMFAYLGINFETHNVAFQFHTAVLERHRTAGDREIETVEVHDRRLKPGQTFSVDLQGKVRVKADGNVVGQSVEPDYSTTAAAPSEGKINFAAGLGARTGASRRIGATSSVSAVGAAPAVTAPTVAEKHPETVKPTAPVIDPFADVAVGSKSSGPAVSASTDVDPFDPFAPAQPSPSAAAPPPPPAKPARSNDPLDALFS